MKKILFISNTLDIGGAELLLKNVVGHLSKSDCDARVWGPEKGVLADDYKNLNIPCYIKDFAIDRINRDHDLSISTGVGKKIQKLIDYCRKTKKKLAIRCAGNITRKILEEFDFSNVDLVGIFDGNKCLFGKDINGYKIYPATDFNNFDADVVIIAHPKPDFLKNEFKSKKIKVIHDLFIDTPLKRFFRSVLYLVQLASPVSYFRKINPDIVFVNNSQTFWAVIVGKILGKKVIWNIHETHEPYTYRVFPHLLYLCSFKLADRFIFPSRVCYSSYKNLMPEEKVNIIHGGIDQNKIENHKSDELATLTRKELNIPLDNKVICNIGAMSEVKGQIYLINAAIKLLKSPDNKNLTFIIVGSRDDEYSDNIKKTVSGFEDNIRIIPATKDAYKFFNMADIYVCSSFMESFPLVVLETMAFKKPIIATNTGGIPDILHLIFNI